MVLAMHYNKWINYSIISFQLRIVDDIDIDRTEQSESERELATM